MASRPSASPANAGAAAGARPAAAARVRIASPIAPGASTASSIADAASNEESNPTKRQPRTAASPTSRTPARGTSRAAQLTSVSRISVSERAESIVWMASTSLAAELRVFAAAACLQLVEPFGASLLARLRLGCRQVAERRGDSPLGFGSRLVDLAGRFRARLRGGIGDGALPLDFGGARDLRDDGVQPIGEDRCVAGPTDRRTRDAARRQMRLVACTWCIPSGTVVAGGVLRLYRLNPNRYSNLNDVVQ